MNASAVRVFTAIAAIVGATLIGYRLGKPPSSLPLHQSPASVADARPPVVRDGWQMIAAKHVTTRANALASSTSALPPGPFVGTVEELKRRVRTGDAQAARRLADGYRRCQFFTPAANEAELEKKTLDQVAGGLNFGEELAGQLRDHAARHGVKLEESKVDPAAVYGQELTAQHELASDCTGIAHAEAADWFKWYEQAAELGEPDAEVGYWNPALAQVSLVDLNEIRHRKDIAVVALQRARARGDWRALAAIGSLLKIGYFAEPDFFGAYAYFFAAAQAPTQPIDALPWIDNGLGRVFAGPDTQTWLARELSDLGSRLDPVQRAQAEQLGVQLYEQCCAVAKR